MIMVWSLLVRVEDSKIFQLSNLIGNDSDGANSILLICC